MTHGVKIERVHSWSASDHEQTVWKEQRMRYGLELENTHDPRTLAELAARAEAAGWDGVFLEDYIVHHSAHDAPTHDPWVGLAAMALSTRRVRLGTMVTPLPRRRPWKLARETVSLDHLSGGRLTLGVGLGDAADISFSQFGEPADLQQRAAMTDEALDVLTGLWSGEPFSYDGRYYRVSDVTLLPRPVQAPRIPIWVGGSWPRRGPMRRAARWDGFVGGKVHADDEAWYLTAAEVRRLKADLESLRTRAEPFDIALGGAERGPDLEQDRAMIRSVAEAGATWWMEYVHPGIGGLDAMRARIEGGPVRAE
jgi:alkanesulfonate monooxygenase SsuD/methylene tetrahydromethanopterin reductase-like flavin-dependent oxidoreductase (luciferase family)